LTETFQGSSSASTYILLSIIMTGTSPFTYQSPSYHSSSYLPKLEANFMRDFSCCGTTLPSLHDLLQHYEEVHANQIPPQNLPRSASQPGSQDQPSNRAALANQAATSVQQQAQQAQQQEQQQPTASNGFGGQAATGGISTQMGGISSMRQSQQQQNRNSGFKSSLPTVEDADPIEDMDMDDAMDTGDMTPPPSAQQQAQMLQAQVLQQQQQQQQQQAQQQRMAQQNMMNPNISNLTGGLRASQPTTPVQTSHPGFPYSNNPTVSSVNTPTLSTNLQQQAQNFSPDTSVPGTPGEDFANVPGDMTMPNNQYFGAGNPYNNFLGGMSNDMIDLCIDEPAKRLFSPNGGMNNQQYAQFRMQNGGQGMQGSELARRIREQQMMNGLGGSSSMMMSGEEIKPFRCPVIGCEKAYKNQNGLKYHKSVSRCTIRICLSSY
jgi:transcription factor SFP1